MHGDSMVWTMEGSVVVWCEVCGRGRGRGRLGLQVQEGSSLRLETSRAPLGHGTAAPDLAETGAKTVLGARLQCTRDLRYHLPRDSGATGGKRYVPLLQLLDRLWSRQATLRDVVDLGLGVWVPLPPVLLLLRTLSGSFLQCWQWSSPICLLWTHLLSRAATLNPVRQSRITHFEQPDSSSI